MYIAHIKNEFEIQTCKEHSIGTAKIAARRLENINMSNVAFLAGILHDAGKYSNDFLEYIKKAVNNENAIKGSVIHTFSGCAFMLKKYHRGKLDYSDVTAELIAYAIAAHHGLFDLVSEDGVLGFEHRLNKQPQYDTDAMNHFFDECISEKEIDVCFKKAIAEIKDKIDLIINVLKKNDDETCFYFGLLSRLILSAVIDGDRKDTYLFMSGENWEGTYHIVWEKYLIHLNKYLFDLKCDTPIAKARKELSDICLSFADNKPDIYQLNIPTGSGKTLSGLRFALQHAQKYGKERIFYIAPLISILEQNADIIKSAIGDDAIVLEHHSNLIIDEDSEDDGLRGNHKLLTENWDSPIIVTTLVQFLNTLFGGKTSQVRRFASLTNSVIILDEVQTVPWRMLSLFNLAINFLQSVCGATILLCSATQPGFHTIAHAMNISAKSFLTKEEKERYGLIFMRSKICNAGKYRLEEIPDYIRKIMLESKSVLVVCNKKKESAFLYHTLDKEDYAVFHLSAAMCMKHRKAVMDEMIYRLGIDIGSTTVKIALIDKDNNILFSDYERHFADISKTLEAGLDSIIQSNGRCNRNGEQSINGKTYIIDCIDESLDKLEEIKIAQDATRELLYQYQRDETAFHNDLGSEEAINYYYQSLYKILGSREGYYDYVVKGVTNINLFSILSQNISFRGKSKSKKVFFMNQAFKMAGAKFKPLDDNTISLIVPYGEGKDLITELASEKAKYDIMYARKMIEKAKMYSVSVVITQASRLLQEGIIYGIYDNSIYAVREEYYDESTGFTLRKEEDKCNILIL